MSNNPTNKDLEKRIKELEALLASKGEEIQRMRTVFLANISHEIRTPMNSIIGFSNLLASEDLTNDQRDLYLKYINSSSDHLLNLIENLIDMAMLESGQIDIHEDDCSLNDLFDELYALFNREKHRREKHSIALLMDKPMTKNRLLIRTDPLRLKQIISNLVSNSMKFTDKGVIVIGYDISDKQFVKFFVKDSGRGITMDDKQQVFESFNREDSPPSADNGGIGIGLSIAKGLIELMGGEIWVEPNVSRGSVFAFTLPRKNVKGKNQSIRLLRRDIRREYRISDQEMAI